MTYIVMGILFVVMLALLSLGVRAVDAMERENRLAEAEIEASRIYQQSLESRVEEVRRYRHDADSLLRAVEQAMRDEGATMPGESARVSATVGASDDRMVFPLVWAAVDLHVRQCAQDGIVFDCRVDDGLAALAAARHVEEADLCIVLQNLLDNAYEENVGIPAQAGPHARFMSLHVGADTQGRLSIVVGNRTASSDPPVLRTRKERPELHGVGLKAVEDIARRHGGSMDRSFDAENRLFTVAVAL
ncbi:MAG: GHKL domain-containing protein [Coriobacteriia bacterium]|nr:GHKL domain-containing protein [Coriobacteriia bacterium]